MLRKTMQFVGSSSSEEQVKMLREVGFLHATGLVARRLPDGESYTIGEDLRQRELGRWDQNNGVIAVVTPGGEVWLAPYRANLKHNECLASVAQSIAVKGKGVFVPCSNGEQLDWHDVIVRMAFPYEGLEISPQQ